jgi:hypothetical protein
VAAGGRVRFKVRVGNELGFCQWKYDEGEDSCGPVAIKKNKQKQHDGPILYGPFKLRKIGLVASKDLSMKYH